MCVCVCVAKYYQATDRELGKKLKSNNEKKKRTCIHNVRF